jgi:hypothetical protein
MSWANNRQAARTALCGMVGLVLLCSSPLARAGNADSFYVSGEAALMGGAVVATSSTGGSIWYNPAGLSALKGARLDVNVNGYALRFGATADFASTVPNTQETRLALLDIDVVPAALTLTRKFGDVGLGIGVFVPSLTAVTLRTQLVASSESGESRLNFGYDSMSRFQEYHAGPGFGWDPLPNLSVGASLLANYRTRLEVTHVTATVETDEAKTSLFHHNSLDSQGVGLEMVLGAQWRLDKHWTWGNVVRTPAVRLGEAVHSVESQLVSDSTGLVDESVEFSRRFGVSTQVLTPFRFHSGVAYAWRDTTASAEASLLLPFENELFKLSERSTWNARAGMKSRLNDVWTVGGGVFTDRSSLGEPTQFQQAQIDYYGATIAADWLTYYGVVSKGRRAFEEPRYLTFGTTIALSYALGIGKIGGARVGPSDDGRINIQENVVDVLAHEITLHIASTLGE